MKLKVNLKNKEVSLDANIENLIEKGMAQKVKNPDRKTAYQIKQEEKRKNEELKHKHQMVYLFALLGITAFFAIFGLIASVLGV
ncbi:MAG: hypothetical protein IKU36_00600 [Bacteroidales bacterium]|nr:hypothetical protein [Bacteroidales bacterium]